MTEIRDEDIPVEWINAEDNNPSGEFLTGNWNMDWLRKANRANALWEAIHLLRLSIMRKSQRIQFSATKTADELEISRSTLWRRLTALEEAGLISVERCQRRWPTVYLKGSPRVSKPSSKAKKETPAPPVYTVEEPERLRLLV
jgi:DNA-binding HxlR family transcriptional regulator